MWRKASVLAVFFAVLVMLSSCTESPEDPLIPGPDVPGDTVSLSEEEIAGIVESCGLSATVRGERLTLADFAALANALQEKMHG